MFTSLPNLLTLSRIAAIPVLVALMFQSGDWARWLACAVFTAAAVTDWFDGYLARSLNQISAFGRMMDPIADKLLVGAALFMLAAMERLEGFSVLPALVILCREILVSGLREYLAGTRISVPVSALAKWKTGIQMTALGVLIVGDAGRALLPLPVALIGEGLLWVAAGLTLVTGWDYLRSSLHHVEQPQPAASPAAGGAPVANAAAGKNARQAG